VVKVVGLNFSSATTPELLLKTLDHYCEYRKTPNGMVLSPVQVSPPDPEYYFRKWTIAVPDPGSVGPDRFGYAVQNRNNNSWSLFGSRYIL
jgi:hypothetical protein